MAVPHFLSSENVVPSRDPLLQIWHSFFTDLNDLLNARRGRGPDNEGRMIAMKLPQVPVPVICA